MFRVTSKIFIGEGSKRVQMDFCHEISVKSSVETLTDTAKVIIPRLLKWEGKDVAGGDDPLFKRGQKIEIWAGYDFNLRQIFKGYIVRVKTKTPIELECEDEMFKLKEHTVSFSLENASLDAILAKTIPSGVKYETTLKVNVGKFKTKGGAVSSAQVLEYLRKNYGIFSRFHEGVLYVGLNYVPSLRKDVKFQFQKNIVSDDLQYNREEDVKIKLTAVSINDNKKIEVTVGDPDGEVRTKYYYNIDKGTLQKFAERDVSRLRYEGYKGKFETFFEPFVRAGDGAEINDPKKIHEDGTYLIKTVEYKIGVSKGAKQEITLDRKISDTLDK